ncbi:ribonuclease H-like domain-containing protein [Tanacetum coccineum]
MSDPNWVKAMNNEIEALNRNNTWTICVLPVGRKPIGIMWIWKIKYKASGEIERYKARLIAKGFSYREVFDYDETFNPVVKMVIVRCLIGIVVVNNWAFYQLDVNNAFLYGDLVEDFYMTLADGYNNEDTSKVELVGKDSGRKNYSRKKKDRAHQPEPIYEGYQNTIDLPDGNNVVPLRSNTIRLVQNGCSFCGLRFEDPNQHLKDFLKLVDSLELDVAIKPSIGLNVFQQDPSPLGRILLPVSLFNSFHREGLPNSKMIS